MEDYKEKYEQALENLKKIRNSNENNKELVDFIEYNYPELKESVDGKPCGGIVLENFNGGEGFYKVNLAYLNKEQVIEIEELVKKWNPKKEDEDVRQYIIRLMKQRDTNVPMVQKALAWLEKQGEQKPQGKRALEVWKDMRLEVYQQASGNRHEPNYSDDSTKMFSLTDIDEIFEKITEKQDERKFVDKCKDCNNVKGCITCTDGDQYAHIEEYNPAWSEEDERRINSIIKNLDEGEWLDICQVDWLKSLKKRMKGE